MGSPASISGPDHLLFGAREARSAALTTDLASGKVIVCAQHQPICFIKCNINCLLDESHPVLQERVRIVQKAVSDLLVRGRNVPVTGLMIYHSANHK